MSSKTIYQEDLAYVHHAGFGDFASKAGPELLRILKRAGITKGKLVDLGSGSGIWANRAQEAGFQVVGIDNSRAMIELARKVAPKAALRRGSLHEAPLPRCEAVTAIGEGFNYVLAENGMLKLPLLFRRIANALRPGGMFIFDVIVAEGPPLESRFWKAGKDWAVLVQTAESFSTRRLKRAITVFRKVGRYYRRTQEIHDVRLFRRREVERALEQAGFAFERASAYGKMPLLSRRQAFICRKLR